MLELVEVPRETWISEFSENAYLAGFGIIRKKESERITRAFLIVEDKEPLGYATILELRDNWAFLQYGAAFRKARNSRAPIIGMKLIMDKLKTEYELLTTTVDARNHAILKIYFKLDFIVCGYKNLYDDNYVELKWDRSLPKLLMDFSKIPS